MLARRRGRGLALEVLYEHDVAHHPAMAVFARRLTEQLEDEEELDDEPFDGPTLAFTRELIHGVVTHRVEIDRLIAKYAPEWPLDQVAVVDRNILRMALYEILVDQAIPIKVAINEAVELSKLYGAEATPRFVNGVLGSLAAEVDALREELFGPALKSDRPA